MMWTAFPHFPTDLDMGIVLALVLSGNRDLAVNYVEKRTGGTVDPAQIIDIAIALVELQKMKMRLRGQILTLLILLIGIGMIATMIRLPPTYGTFIKLLLFLPPLTIGLALFKTWGETTSLETKLRTLGIASSRIPTILATTRYILQTLNMGQDPKTVIKQLTGIEL